MPAAHKQSLMSYRRLSSLPARLNAPSAPSARDYIESVEISGLFGAYDFPHLKLFEATRANPQIAFLYGDNGAGKTTILNLIYRTLSYHNEQSNRSSLAKIVFKKVKINLSSGAWVEVSRDSARAGEYVYRIRQNGRAFRYGIKVDGDFDATQKLNPKLPHLLNRLKALRIEIFFIPDSRLSKSTVGGVQTLGPESDEEWRPQYMAYRRDMTVAQLEEYQLQHLDALVEETYDRMRSKALSAGSESDKNASIIYLEVARLIANTAAQPEAREVDRKKKLIDQLESIRHDIGEFTKYGLIPDIGVQDMRRVVAEAPDGVMPQLEAVLSPYLLSIRSRLTAVDSVLELMSALEKTLNRFLTRKRVSVGIMQGIQFYTESGAPLLPKYLSSGERHLLALFCTTVISGDFNSLLIIDEPELSLNFKWQRVLVESLMRLAGGRGTQIVMASHATEIMADYEDSVVKLNPKAHVASAA